MAVSPGASDVIRTHAPFIWSVADLLRGDYKQSEYGRVILPLVVLRRLDCVLEPTKADVLARLDALNNSGIENVEPVLCAVSGEQFYNTSKLDLPTPRFISAVTPAWQERVLPF
jgi:type I restriction enzyme M protein